MDKREFKEKANKIINDAASKINELKAKKETVEADAKSKYEQSIKDLESKKVELEAKFKELEKVSDEKWDEAKKAFSSASDSFKKGISEITSLVS